MNINVLMWIFGFSSEYSVVGGILTPSKLIGFDPSIDLVVQTYSKSEGFALQSYNHGIGWRGNLQEPYISWGKSTSFQHFQLSFQWFPIHQPSCCGYPTPHARHRWIPALLGHHEGPPEHGEGHSLKEFMKGDHGVRWSIKSPGKYHRYFPLK